MKTTVLKTKETVQIRYPLSKSLVGAAGMLKGKLPNSLKYQKAIRKEWDQRLNKSEMALIEL